jgi:hypothetical protein
MRDGCEDLNREICRRRRAGSLHTCGKPARLKAPRADDWSVLACSAQCHAEYERPLGRVDANYVIHVCGLHDLWRKALRPRSSVADPYRDSREEAGSWEVE